METERDILNTSGTILIIAGVAVWGIYAFFRWGMGWNVTGRQFLPYHLAGVIPGMILRRRQFLRGIMRRLQSRQGQH
ncbi:MAG: hypothetical protein KAJ90_05310 [Desulfobacterales bacterium]|nr:hypothetical protein [Desulfobacterales bacterium]